MIKIKDFECLQHIGKKINALEVTESIEASVRMNAGYHHAKAKKVNGYQASDEP
jgi:hypothetical protein